MAQKNWYETMDANDCLSGHVTWNDMIDYIEHSACTDFIIYSTCTDSGQAFKFTMEAGESIMLGASTSGYDLKIKATSDDTYPFIKLEGDSDISLYSGDDIYFYSESESFMKFSYDANDAIFETESSNHNIYLKPEGSGVVKFGTYSALSGESVAGYITIKDAAGNTRKLAVVA